MDGKPMMVFLHLAYACVRESVRTRDWVMIGRILFMTCRHSGV